MFGEHARVHRVARLDIFARNASRTLWHDCQLFIARVIARSGLPPLAGRQVGRSSERRAVFGLTFVQLLSQLESLFIRRAAVIDFVQVQRRVGECLLLEGAGTSFHQDGRRTSGDVELRAQREAEHCGSKGEDIKCHVIPRQASRRLHGPPSFPYFRATWVRIITREISQIFYKIYFYHIDRLSSRSTKHHG